MRSPRTDSANKTHIRAQSLTEAVFLCPHRRNGWRRDGRVAQRRIRELEDEVKILRKAAAAVEKVVPPKDRFQLVAELVDEGVDARRACRELAVSRSGYYEWRTRAPSTRAIRHVWLSVRITAIHEASHGTYGALRVQAELVHAQGVTVGHNTVALLMRRAGPAGRPLRRRAKRVPASITVTDLVRREFARRGPNQGADDDGAKRSSNCDARCRPGRVAFGVVAAGWCSAA